MSIISGNFGRNLGSLTGSIIRIRDWILAKGFWNDAGSWQDNKTWID